MHRLKILITGISGFIGRSLVESIVNNNLPWDICGIDIKSPVFLNPEYLRYINFQPLDIRDENAVNTYFSNKCFDGVVHLAAISRVLDAEKDKQNCIATNLYGTKYVVENVAKNSDTWLVFGSSREVYGEQKEFPVRESAPLNPINVYGECKLKGEMLVSELIGHYAIMRFCNVYGNVYDIPDRVIPKFIDKALNDVPMVLEGGEQIIDFTNIKDTVCCIVRVMEKLQSGEMVRDVLHISHGKGIPIKDVANTINSILNKEVPILYRPPRTYDVQKFIGDPLKRISLLGDSLFVGIEEGIKNML